MKMLKFKMKLIIFNLIGNMDSFQRYYWFKGLNNKKIDNLLKLKINYKMLKNMKWFITNIELLGCGDYEERINFLSKIDPSNYSILYRLDNSSFLSSHHLIEDLTIIGNIPLSKFFNLFSNNDFNISKYHIEDLKLIVEEIKKSNDVSYLIKLACNTTSIKDDYHCTNMRLLRNKCACKYLYLLMTNENIIESPEYRTYIEKLYAAKSETEAQEIYEKINAQNKPCDPEDSFIEIERDIDHRLKLVFGK